MPSKAKKNQIAKEKSFDFKTPTEIWAVACNDVLVGPAMDDDGTDSFLAWPTKEQAEQGMEFQRENYLNDPEDMLEVVRLFPKPE